MKPCTGCRHLKIVGKDLAVCAWIPGQWRLVEYFNPVTGIRRMTYEHDPIPGWSGPFRPTVDWMREAGQPCGPDAALWSPNLRRRLWRWLTGGA